MMIPSDTARGDPPHFAGEAAMTDEQVNPGDDAPEGTPGTGENVCPECNGTGDMDGKECPNCAGLGTVIEGIGGA
jgi:hypothetical protein